ncbi:telomerase reverse [Niveomyces insectorum RCEF 264]|uniref:Telomerase reverse transcriptase n=1 Tax=Niveomyces insectorum RCEF 264 TaxID=1081102 RepID=A0A167U4B2_9HYPO|nr:telomerase reverse [Niveomyces insectorum RCEF 264]
MAPPAVCKRTRPVVDRDRSPSRSRGSPAPLRADDDRPRKKRKVAQARKDDPTGPKQLAAATAPAAVPSAPHGPAVQHALLAQYYPRVETLRAYLLTRLPASSRIRRKKLRLVGKTPDPRPVERLLSRLLDTALIACPHDANGGGGGGGGSGGGGSSAGPNTNSAVQQPADDDDRPQLRTIFLQTRQADESYVTVSNASEGVHSPQSEIVDFVVWLLFKRAKQNATTKVFGAGNKRVGDFPKHVLCHGFQRGQAPRQGPAATAADGKPVAMPVCTVPGLYATKPNQHAQTLKEPPWPQLLALLGASGQAIMTDLLVDCSLFLPMDAGYGNYVQLTGRNVRIFPPLLPAGLTTIGKPLCDVISAKSDNTEKPSKPAAPHEKRYADIVFVRSRMYYAKPNITSADVLNRFPYQHSAPKKPVLGRDVASINKEHTVHIMMYMFPRQFGLHNVFTSVVDRTTTAQKFQDYTLREKEIVKAFGKRDRNGSGNKVPVPKRLRGLPMCLVEKLRILHSRCSYFELLQHYCPDPNKSNGQKMSASDEAVPIADDAAMADAIPMLSSERDAQESKQMVRAPPEHDDATRTNSETVPEPPETSALVDLATPLAQISAFCQAVFKNVIPNDFWGSKEAIQCHNKALFLKKVDAFLRLRRFESMSLHTLVQGLKIADIEWLAPPGLKDNKLSQTDLRKRQEIFAEFLYYLFDSFLVPLVRSNFYVTESNGHRNRLFYFRHDVWRRIAEPAMASLKISMFEEVKQSDAVRILESRDLSFGQVRLLPKQANMRPIMNLRRRVMKKGEARLTSSINMILSPVASMLNFEMKQHPERLGSSLFSVRSLYTRLKAFKQHMDAKKQRTFYFAKVDVKSAFDTIPQAAVVQLVGTLPSHPLYYIERHVEITAPEKSVRHSGPVPGGHRGRVLPPRTWQAVAKAGSDTTGFHDLVETRLAAGRKNTVFVDSAFRKAQDAEALAGLAATHILQNLVKIGKKFYRQKTGIPQGSVLSSALCNYFYADLEAKELGFLHADGDGDGDCLLLRLIDDFLLITTNEAKAARFVQVMHRGHPRYGVAVNPNKTLVNFRLTVDGHDVARLPPGAPFPYCGTHIHCSTLNLTRDREIKNNLVFDTLTVEHARSPGYHFKRKVFNYFKIQSHHMFFDTSHNSLRTALRNLHSAFTETATKMWAHARCLPSETRPSARLVITTIEELAEIAFVSLNRKSRALQRPDYKFSVSKMQLTWCVVLVGFSCVF